MELPVNKVSLVHNYTIKGGIIMIALGMFDRLIKCSLVHSLVIPCEDISKTLVIVVRSYITKQNVLMVRIITTISVSVIH